MKRAYSVLDGIEDTKKNYKGLYSEDHGDDYEVEDQRDAQQLNDV